MVCCSYPEGEGVFVRMIKNRRVIQAFAAAIVYYLVFVLGFSLLYTVLIAGALV